MEIKDIISWSKDYFLSWSDFQAEPNSAAYEDSSSNIKYHHTWTVDSEMIDGQIFYFINDINLTTQFLKHLSWVRDQHATQQLLKHEQGHFDLAESLIPEIIQSMKEKFQGKRFPTRGQNDEQRKQFAKGNSGLLIANELENWFHKLHQKREQYDKETNFGNNLDAQKLYNEKFAQLRN
ncbi:MAG: hypothetical protein GTN97_04370 [Nitrosopumilaceae archaeon]|nr:hypothetical protein [Nitrosopumilaceae archaeon]NIP10274.1 hypothetical protein [Nitrosopumilaceae archaeon]NIS95137.1 hypothetical protein [Nitrosopumilaceae archaeon]